MKDLFSKFGAWPQTAWRFFLELSRELWARVLLLGALALVALGLATMIGPLLPNEVSGYVSGQAADRLLSIIANAMLAVTTFSLTVMVTVFRSSSSQFTPRLHRLIVQDKTTQNTLASFIGAYVFALVAIVLRELKIFADDHALVLFVMTCFVLGYVVWSLIRWTLHLQTFGSLMDATRQVERITSEQFQQRLDSPCLGANPWGESTELPEGSEAVRAQDTGYITHLYQESLNERANDLGVDLYLPIHPGSFVMIDDVIAYYKDRGDGTSDEEDADIADVVSAHITIGDVRSFEQDPRFGLMVLGEIASKALSPGINDPGTAIDVITRSARILEKYRDEETPAAEREHKRLWIKPLKPTDLIEDAFGALARDGSGVIEVQQRLQAAFSRLIEHESPAMALAAATAAGQELQRARTSLAFKPDFERLRSSTAHSVLAKVDAEDD